ncbi:hypothetical protein SO802_015656 [Lithocarpus litseifolius]|uniref:Uncharacterized protein n=1 Tax=Lithocarpus litseifolius TaxID=425828 RepID=A0AAW2CUA4_9ROSI
MRTYCEILSWGAKISGLPLGVDLFFGDVLSRKGYAFDQDKMRPDFYTEVYSGLCFDV